MSFNPRWVIGKRVARVEMRPFLARDFGPEKATNPRVIFHDGSYIEFFTQETDGGEYGTGIRFTKAQKGGGQQ